MGLYDRVFYPSQCEICKRSITEFQTQDTRNPAVIGVPLSVVSYFYTFCYCGAYITYQRTGIDEFQLLTTNPRIVRRYHGHAQPAYPDGEGPET